METLGSTVRYLQEAPQSLLTRLESPSGHDSWGLLRPLVLWTVQKKTMTEGRGDFDHLGETGGHYGMVKGVSQYSLYLFGPGLT